MISMYLRRMVATREPGFATVSLWDLAELRLSRAPEHGLVDWTSRG